MHRDCCALFQSAQAKAGRAHYLRETLYRALAFGHRAPVSIPLDTS